MTKRHIKLIPFIALALIAGVGVMLAPPWHSAKASPQIWIQNDCSSTFPMIISGDYHAGPDVLQDPAAAPHNQWHVSSNKITAGGTYKTKDLTQTAGDETISFSGGNQNAAIACVHIYPESNGVCTTSLIYTTAAACNWGAAVG